MFSNLDRRHAADIDFLVNHHCSNPSTYRELSQLRRLFTSGFHRNLERLLNGALPAAGQPSVCQVQLGWIDKIPLAESDVLAAKTELGDVALFAFDERRDLSGNLLNRTARAALLQAKIAQSVSQLAEPSVPVGASSSTPRELCLLSQWPVFNLYQTSGHSSACLTNVHVAPSASPPPHGWFIAAPGQRPTAAQKAAWRSWWMAGEASRNASCDTSIGELLVAFLAPRASAITVGAPFRHSAGPGCSPPSSSESDWSDLCNEILRILTQYYAPRHLFGGRQPRIYGLACWLSAYMPFDLAFREARSRAGSFDRSPIPPDAPADGEEEDPGMIAMIVTVTRLGEEDRERPE